MNLTRRTALLAALAPWGGPSFAAAADALAALEQRAGGRLGVSLLDTGTLRRWAHRGDERFALCSTFKVLLAGAVLHGAEHGRLRLDERLPVKAEDRVPHMPATEAWLARGWATPRELARAAQVTSDNLAANLLLRRLGGPEGLTAWLREQGDAATRIDRYEPAMNRMRPGDASDTTQPTAMADTVARLCTGQVLKPAGRQQLIAWMQATRTGMHRLRAGLPKGWRAGDKTGTGLGEGEPDRINDVAIFWPPGSAPVVVACYYEGPRQNSPHWRPEDEAVLAQVGRLAAAWALQRG